jgi:hypothetical protein
MSAAIRDYRSSGGGKIIRQAMNVAAAVLVATATAALFSIRARALFVPPQDPLLLVSTRLVFSIYAGVALAVAIFCLVGKPSPLKAMLILWLALTVAVFALGIQWNGHHENAYLGDLANAFSLLPGTAYLFAEIVFAGLLGVGSAALLWFWLGGHMAESQRMACPYCGGHIEFLMQNLGQQIPCPHCFKEITLDKPGMRKMSCYFCKGHIEFPAHAIGEKIHCPHCKMDITLKEPA